ncbi:sensor histidine kinase [Butyrivibrio sp. MC2013]|uniref:sensor histidine kinase n=1 Tax=Butyrivibrio sp. MC2013 TaxID=1280686 RepID=UPI0018CB9572|nr:GHKL domain-containing protein [Butyrivibrio sp. MC2013]
MGKKHIIAAIFLLAGFITGIAAGLDFNNILIGPASTALFISILFTLLLFDVRLSEGILMCLANWMIVSIAEGVLYSIVGAYDMQNELVVNLVVSGALVIFALLIYITIGRRFETGAFRMTIGMWIVFDLILLVLIMMTSFFMFLIVYQIQDNRIELVGRVLLSVSSFAIILLLFVFVYYYSSACEFRIREEMLDDQIEQQREYYQLLLSKEEETRKFRHDIIADLVGLLHYCDKGEYAQLKQYLEEMAGAISGISSKTYDVGNELASAMINYYLNPEKTDCEVEVIGMIPDKISVNDRDLGIILSNIVRNAVGAAGNTRDGHIQVKISTGKKYINIIIKNTFDGDLLFDKNGIPVTTKAQKREHGFGLQNVTELVKKNNGEYNFTSMDGIFSAEIYLPV